MIINFKCQLCFGKKFFSQILVLFIKFLKKKLWTKLTLKPEKRLYSETFKYDKIVSSIYQMNIRSILFSGDGDPDDNDWFGWWLLLLLFVNIDDCRLDWRPRDVRLALKRFKVMFELNLRKTKQKITKKNLPFFIGGNEWIGDKLESFLWTFNVYRSKC